MADQEAQAAEVRAAGVRAPAAPLEGTVIPLEGMRRTVATRLQESWRSAPHIALTVEADMAAGLALRDELNGLAQELDGVRVSVTAILVRACAWALQRHPRVNAWLQGDAVHQHRTANIGVAVAVDEGLIVPSSAGRRAWASARSPGSSKSWRGAPERVA